MRIPYFHHPLFENAFVGFSPARPIHQQVGCIGEGVALEKSVEDTAKKYGGYLHGLIEDEKFVSILILPVRK